MISTRQGPSPCAFISFFHSSVAASPESRSRVVNVESCEPRVLLANTGILQGVVLISGTSQGLAGATVQLESLPNQTILQTMTTGANGVYQFEGLAPGNYRIVETPPAGYVNGQTDTNNSPLTPILGSTSKSIDVQLGDFGQLQNQLSLKQQGNSDTD